jgi:hypothetical protein
MLPDDLPRLDDDQARDVLNHLGIGPDPAEVDALYFGCHRRPGAPGSRTAAPAVLGQLQLHARTGTKIELRELASLAGCDQSTVWRVVHHAEALGVLLVAGGVRRRDDQGRVRRTCQSYRLQYAPGMSIPAHRTLTARIHTWAIEAGVLAADARSCCRRGLAGQDHLIRLGRLQQLQRGVRERRVRQAEARLQEREDDRQREGGLAAVASVMDDVRALLGQVQHGPPNTNRASRPAKCSGSWVGISHGEIPTCSAHGAHVRSSPQTDDERAASLDVVAYAERLGSKLPWLDGHTVIAEARRRGVPAWKAAREYVGFASDALDHARSGRVQHAARWAMGAFRRSMAAQEVG